MLKSILVTFMVMDLIISNHVGGDRFENQSPAFSDHTCDLCTWSSPSGAFYDLSGMCGQQYTVRMDRPRAAHLHFGICSTVQCEHYSNAYGCLSVPGMEPTSTGGRYSLEQIEPNIATAGIRVILEGGEKCGKNARKTVLTIECQSDESRLTSVPSPLRGWEGDGDEICVYYVHFKTSYGCPTYQLRVTKPKPSITAVTGCTNSQPKLRTEECLSSGGSILIIHGVDFKTHAQQDVTSSVNVGPYVCVKADVIDAWTVTCELLAGSGEGHAISLILKMLSGSDINSDPSPTHGLHEVYLSSHSVTVSFKPVVDYSRHFDSFMDLGVGGLKKQINELYRRAFASRGIPSSVLDQLGIDHAKGIMLYGPPGSGKTLLAKTIASILNTDKVTLINAPEIMSKFLGESEKNLRSHFDAAERDWKEYGDASDLHVIIIDEIDAICKKRGKSDSSAAAAAYDSVVNQLLTKMDGLKSLHNVLVIGMTNRKDIIDTALLRPGRFEVQIEVGLPDEEGRLEIFTIHTREMKMNGYLADDVDLRELSQNTPQYSGAEIAGLVRLAASFALDRKYGEEKSNSSLSLGREDFIRALEQFKPAYTQREDDVLQEFLPRGYTQGMPTHDKIIDDIIHISDMMKKLPEYRMETILLFGQHGAGKSGLAAYLSKKNKFDFVKVLKASELLWLGSGARTDYVIDLFHDAFKSTFGLLILDDLHLLMECVMVQESMTASNEMIHTLNTLLSSQPSPGRKLLVVGSVWSESYLTSSYAHHLGLHRLFNIKFHVPLLDVSSMSNLLEIEGFKSSEGRLLSLPDVNMSLRDFRRVLDCVEHWLDIASMERQKTPQNYLDYCVADKMSFRARAHGLLATGDDLAWRLYWRRACGSYTDTK